MGLSWTLIEAAVGIYVCAVVSPSQFHVGSGESALSEIRLVVELANYFVSGPKTMGAVRGHPAWAPLSVRSIRLFYWLQYRNVVSYGGAAHIKDAGDFRSVDLHIACVSCDLHRREHMH